MPFSFGHSLRTEDTPILHLVPRYHSDMFSSWHLVSKVILLLLLLPQEQSSLHVSRNCILFTVMSAPRKGLESIPLFAICILSTYYVSATGLAPAHRKELGSTALESGTFSVSFRGCVWRLDPALSYLGTRQNRGSRSGKQVEVPWAAYQGFQLLIAA